MFTILSERVLMMTKSEFINTLIQRLSGLDEGEITKAVAFYSEMIDDRIEDSMTEEEAVESLGSIDSIVNEIFEQLPLSAVIKQKVKKNQNNTLWIILSIIGFPVWFPLSVALLVIVFALYISIWAVIISLFAAVVSFIVAGVCSVGAGIAFCVIKTPAVGAAIIGVGLMLTGLFILLIKPMIALCKQTGRFTGFICRKLFGSRKGNAL